MLLTAGLKEWKMWQCGFYISHYKTKAAKAIEVGPEPLVTMGKRMKSISEEVEYLIPKSKVKKITQKTTLKNKLQGHQGGLVS